MSNEPNKFIIPEDLFYAQTDSNERTKKVKGIIDPITGSLFIDSDLYSNNEDAQVKPLFRSIAPFYDQHADADYEDSENNDIDEMTPPSKPHNTYSKQYINDLRNIISERFDSLPLDEEEMLPRLPSENLIIMAPLRLVEITFDILISNEEFEALEDDLVNDQSYLTYIVDMAKSEFLSEKLKDKIIGTSIGSVFYEMDDYIKAITNLSSDISIERQKVIINLIRNLRISIKNEVVARVDIFFVIDDSYSLNEEDQNEFEILSNMLPTYVLDQLKTLMDIEPEEYGESCRTYLKSESDNFPNYYHNSDGEKNLKKLKSFLSLFDTDTYLLFDKSHFNIEETDNYISRVIKEVIEKSIIEFDTEIFSNIFRNNFMLTDMDEAIYLGPISPTFAHRLLSMIPKEKWPYIKINVSVGSVSSDVFFNTFLFTEDPVLVILDRKDAERINDITPSSNKDGVKIHNDLHNLHNIYGFDNL